MPDNDPERVMKNIGRRVAELRVERGLTQERIALTANVSLTYWRRLESGANLTIRSLTKVADVLDVEVIELLRPPQRNASPLKVPVKKRRRR